MRSLLNKFGGNIIEVSWLTPGPKPRIRKLNNFHNMLKDHNHDLVHALSEKNDALWRYRRHYLDSAAGCEHCTVLWKILEQDDEKHIGLIVEEIKRHIEEERFD